MSRRHEHPQPRPPILVVCQNGSIPSPSVDWQELQQADAQESQENNDGETYQCGTRKRARKIRNTHPCCGDVGPVCIATLVGIVMHARIIPG